jgi:hypothetical protein
MPQALLKSAILFFGFIILGMNCYAQSVSSSELIDKAKEYDGKTVVYQGEVIGEVMVRGENAWINLNDGKNALGVWAKKDLTREIANAGSYKTIGDLIEVEGVFHRSCLEHGGDLDIHGSSLREIKGGYRVRQKLSWRRQKIAYSLGAILIIIWISSILAKSRKTK